MLSFAVMMSCMKQVDFSLIEKSNLRDVETLIVNQCDVSNESTVFEGIHSMINTPERGLSRSRNMGLERVSADICLLSDDDEVFIDDLERKVVAEYEAIPDADIIVFDVANKQRVFGGKRRQLKKLELLKVASWQISLKRKSVYGKIAFDENLGAGTGNGGGEENKFLFDCFEKGLKIYYAPVEIATVAQEVSTWFNGFDSMYFYNRGKTTRYILGMPLAVIYAIYFLLVKRKIYSNAISVWEASKSIVKGIVAHDINASWK